jgi:hypothetical protein
VCSKKSRALIIEMCKSADELSKSDSISCMKTRKSTKFGKDARRKHRHWKVTLYYKDGEIFARVYTDRERAAAFTDRQKKSPVVRMARVTEIRSGRRSPHSHSNKENIFSRQPGSGRIDCVHKFSIFSGCHAYPRYGR